MHRVLFHPKAIRELEEIHDYIAVHASEKLAKHYVAKIRDYCMGFETFPNRGVLRDDIAPGIRVVGFRRRVSIVFRVEKDVCWMLGVHYGGRNIDELEIDES